MRSSVAIDHAAIERALAPFGHSATLPGSAYTSTDVFEWEQRRFFEGSWVCVGRPEALSRVGARTVARVGSQEILLLRDDDAVRAFFNVCRHRGHQLLQSNDAEPSSVLRCPYHAWVYALDGTLRGAADFEGVPNFDRADYSLVAVELASWHGWLFVNVSGDAPPFADYVNDLEGLVADHHPERLVPAVSHRYVVGANWKIVVENYHECYHCSSIHPELCHVSPPRSGSNFEPAGAWVGGSMDLMDHAETMSLTGKSEGVILPELDDRKRRQVFYLGLFPNLLLSLHPDYVMTHRIEPLAPDRTQIDCEWLFDRRAVARDDFDPSYATDFWDLTNRQDWHACESVQRGMSSRGHRPGPLSPREDAVYQFITLVARGYLEGRVTRPAHTRPAPASLRFVRN